MYYKNSGIWYLYISHGPLEPINGDMAGFAVLIYSFKCNACEFSTHEKWRPITLATVRPGADRKALWERPLPHYSFLTWIPPMIHACISLKRRMLFMPNCVVWSHYVFTLHCNHCSNLWSNIHMCLLLKYLGEAFTIFGGSRSLQARGFRGWLGLLENLGI